MTKNGSLEGEILDPYVCQQGMKMETKTPSLGHTTSSTISSLGDRERYTLPFGLLFIGQTVYRKRSGFSAIRQQAAITASQKVTPEAFIQDLNELCWEEDLRYAVNLKTLFIYHRRKVQKGKKKKNSWLCPYYELQWCKKELKNNDRSLSLRNKALQLSPLWTNGYVKKIIQMLGSNLCHISLRTKKVPG